MDRAKYPANWELFSANLRYGRSEGRCECTGECGLHQPNPGPRRCLEVNHTPARWARGRVVLTVAHLCTCYPICADPHHVKAMCQGCHLRCDKWHHARNRRLQRYPIPVSL